MKIREKKQEMLRAKDDVAARLRFLHDEKYREKMQEKLRTLDADAERLRLAHDETERKFR